MPPNITRNFSAASRVAHMDCVLQVQLLSEGRQVVGVGVHLVAVPGLRGTPVPAPVMSDYAVAKLAKVQHLSVPVIRAERPSVAEHYGLALTPVLVINRRAVFRCDRSHKAPPFFDLSYDSSPLPLWPPQAGAAPENAYHPASK